MKIYDAIIIGAGAAGLKAAAQLHIRKKSVVVLDMGENPARKVVISGGGNCNFTNTHADSLHYFGENPRFVLSALNQFTPFDTLNWVKQHNIDYIEKEPGRFFCKNGAENIITALIQDIKDSEIIFNANVTSVQKNKDIFTVQTNNKIFQSKSLIVATGGLSYAHLGVSNIGHMIAKQFGHKIIPVKPGLCAIKTNCFNAELSGISLPVEIIADKHKIKDDLLFTHFGIGGPAAYRTSLIANDKIIINFAPKTNIFEQLKNAKKTDGKKKASTILSNFVPSKFAQFIVSDCTKNIADYKDSDLLKIADKINKFEVTNIKPVGMQSAEVTVGGVSTDKISSKTMESQLCPGLFFAGEVLDIAGDLGGYNLQWAFSSGFVAGSNA